MTVTVGQAAEFLRASDNFLILTHRRPDGDTTGGAGALCRGLRLLGKHAYIFENPEITPRYAPLIVPFAPPKDFVPDTVVSVDVADTDILTHGAEGYENAIDLVIDHHRSNPAFGKRNIIRPEAGACCEVVYDILVEMGLTLTKEVGEALYIGVSTDTGCFRYSNTVPHTLRVAAACLEAGVDGGEINRALFETKSAARFAMDKIVYDTMEFFHDGHIALVTLWRCDIDRTGATMDDLDSIASLTRQIEGVHVGITLTENKDGSCKVSVRSTKEVDSSAICTPLGGGGHLRAAGVSFGKEYTVQQVRDILLKKTLEVYHASVL